MMKWCVCGSNECKSSGRNFLLKVKSQSSRLQFSWLMKAINIMEKEKAQKLLHLLCNGSTGQTINCALSAQDSLKQRLVMVDDFPWKLPTFNASLEAVADVAQRRDVLRYVGGVDMSYCKEDSSLACAALVILDLQTLQVVHQEYSIVRLDVPYVPGFLAFREAPILLKLLEKVKQSANQFYPQLIMVDGNGLLHPRGFGLACHLGVSADCPAVGIGKNLHHVDGLTLSSVKQLLEAKGDFADMIYLTGCSGRTWGVAIRSCAGSTKPIFVSVGHRISLETAVAIVRMTCKYRVPEPIRQADIRSRDYLRKHGIV